jgi:hypothetical protein
MSFFQVASVGLSLFSAMNQKKAGDKASAFSAAIGEENAKIIERDIDIADRQIEILGRNLALSNERKGKAYRRFRGAGTAIYGGGGIELSRGAPVTVELASAAEFEYELSVDAYNTSIAILEQEDRKVEAGMRANVSRMGGQAQASAYAAQGTTALLTGLGTTIGNASDYGMFTQSYWDDFSVS